MRRALVVAFVLCVAVTECVAARAFAAGQRHAADTPVGRGAAIAPGTAFSAFAQSVLTTPMPVRGTDGRYHLVYELVLTNTTHFSISVTGVQVRNARTHGVLLSLAGRTLATNMNPLGGPTASEASASAATAVGPSQAAILWLDVRLRRRANVPALLEHRVIASARLPDGTERSVTIVLVPIPVARGNPIVLGPPVAGGPWLASEGCCGVSHHRRGLISINGTLAVPQRFAIDWFLLDGQHRAWVGDPRHLRSYLSYGRPALAAADGTVVDTRDGLPDQHPPHAPAVPPINDTVGNHVVLKIRAGLFLLYGHLKPGSVRVRVGQRVRRGQVVGLIGTSGNSTTPHLHFQVMTTATFFPTDSPPFVFDRFAFVGQVTQRIWDDNIGLQPTGMLPFASAPGPRTRRLEMPLDRNVVTFP